jgi:3-oxoadipate enol-lactonase
MERDGSMPVMTYNGVRLAYRWSGLPSGRVLVLSHSLGASGAMWQPQVDAFAPRFRLLIPDHRGHGQSSVPDGPYRIEHFGQELTALLDHLQLDRVYFCGLSLGGMIGMWMGQNVSQRIERMVLCNTAAKILDTTLLRSRMHGIERDGLASIADNVIDRWFTEPFRIAHPEAIEAARRMLLATSARGYANTSGAVCELDLREGLGMIACPTLVIGGRYDKATPLSWNEAIASSIPDGRVAALDAAHLSNIEARDEFNRVVAGFLS